MKVARFSALRTGRFYSQEDIPLVLISIRAWVGPRTIVSSGSEDGLIVGSLSWVALTNPDVLNSNSVYRNDVIVTTILSLKHGNPGMVQSQTKLYTSNGNPDVTSLQITWESGWGTTGFSRTTPLHGISYGTEWAKIWPSLYILKCK